MSDVAIKVENLGKLYRLGEVGTGTLSHDLNRWVAKVRGKEDPFAKIGESNDRTSKGESDYVWALKDLNFEVNRGDVLGIIGRNGAGKSTLLKLLSKVTKPTQGNIKINGRIASLLEVGTGFHPEMTGRENIYLNGAIMGMTKREISSKFDEIVQFAGVERYVDTPVKRYSSGMYVRLAFAVAAHLEPEILIVDEVLAVGDAEFQKKCLGKMKDVSVNDGRTVLFVSHNMAAVKQLCTKGLLMSKGTVEYFGGIQDVVDQYISNGDFVNSYLNSFRDYPIKIDPAFKPVAFGIVDSKNEIFTGYSSNNEPINVQIIFDVEELNDKLTFGIAVYNNEDEVMFWSYSKDLNEEVWPQVRLGRNNFIIKIPPHLLNEGDYRVELIASIHFRYWIAEFGKSARIALNIRGGLSDSEFWIDRRPGVIAPHLEFVSIG